MKFTDKLKKDSYYKYDTLNDMFYPASIDELEDELRDDIEYWYLPRPIFEDGQPAQFGDKFLYNDEEIVIDTIQCLSNGTWWLNDEYFIGSYEFLRRPCEDDSQEKIDEDKKLDVITYRLKYDLPNFNAQDPGGCYRAMIDHLLMRQRKVDGVE